MTSQIARFLRVFLFALAPGALTIITHQSPLTIVGVEGFVTPALEVAWRAIHPTVPAATPPAPPASSSANSGPWQPV